MAWALVTVATAYLPANAAELVTAELSSRQDAYNIRTEVILDGSPALVRDKLLEYGTLPSLNPNIERVVILTDGDDGGTRLRLHARACFLMICQRYQWVQRVQRLPDGQIFAIVESADSDFHSGWFRYRFVADGDQCRLILDAQLAPKNGVTSSRIVRSVMKRVLADEAVTLATRLEVALYNVVALREGLLAQTGG